MAGGAASGKKLTLAKRRLAVLTLRIQGANYREIAAHLREQEDEVVSQKYSYSHARKDAMFVLRAMNNAAEGYAAEIKRLDLERLDELLFTFWPLAIEGDYMAFDRIMKIMDQRAKMENLHAPVKVALTNAKGDDRPATVDDALRSGVMAAVLARMGIEIPEVDEPEDAGGDV